MRSHYPIIALAGLAGLAWVWNLHAQQPAAGPGRAGYDYELVAVQVPDLTEGRTGKVGILKQYGDWEIVDSKLKQSPNEASVMIYTLRKLR